MAQDNSIQVLTKIVAILDQLAMEGEATPARLAELIGEPRSTVYRLLNNLQRTNLVEAGAQRGTYRLGLKLFRLGSAVMSRFNERQAALPVMERLHEETGETVYLVVRRGFEAVCIERIEGRRVQILGTRLGDAVPLHVGATPRILLAYEPHDFWEDYLARGNLQAFTPRTPTTRDELLPLLQAILTDGYAVSDGDITPGIAAIGAPIFDHTGAIRAAISVSGIRSELLGNTDTKTHVIDKVVAGAKEISHALGFDQSVEVPRRYKRRALAG
jgi:DNA-binding IclR family transcriptional regulator